jgi:hypothetical protein
LSGFIGQPGTAAEAADRLNNRNHRLLKKAFIYFLREKLTKQERPVQSFTENAVFEVYSKERRTKEDHRSRQNADFEQHRQHQHQQTSEKQKVIKVERLGGQKRVGA